MTIAIVLTGGCSDKNTAKDGDEVKPAADELTAAESSNSGEPSNSDETPKQEMPELSGPTLEPRPELARVETSSKKGGVTMTTRLLVPTVTAKDRIDLEIRFTGDDGPFNRTSGLGAKTLDWTKTLRSLRLEIEGPDGKTSTFTADPKATLKDSSMPLAHLQPLLASLSTSGFEIRFSTGVPWAQPGELFEGPGRYRLHLRGALAIGSKPVVFDSGAIVVEVAGDEAIKPLAQLEAAAAAYVKDQGKLARAPAPAIPTVQDKKGNRVVRFAVSDMSGRYDDKHVEVVLSATGEVLSLVSQTFFRCLVEGTFVDTPSGPRPVESLVVGDSIIAHEPVSGVRVVTQITDIVRTQSDDLIVVTDQLTVTGRHPLWAGGAWKRARDIEPGDLLLALDGSTPAAAPTALTAAARVYDLSVGWPHTYFAGGILVHNKAAETAEARSVRTDLDYRPEAPDEDR